MPRPMPVLEGDMVRLRPLDPESDAAEYLRIMSDPEMTRYTNDLDMEDEEAARKELERLASLEDITIWAIEETSTGRLVGRYFVCLKSRKCELVAGEGSRIAREFWRKGHNRDARRLVFRYVFETLGADAFETHCMADNTNSRLSIEAHGFTLTREEMMFVRERGRDVLVRHYRMTRAEWEAMN
jgi:RimJ/RimL family protein N-acetyltransferase